MAVQIVYETHATTSDNERGIATGWLPGELSPAGVANARELGRRRNSDDVDVVITSDLARALQTVDIAFPDSRRPVVVDARLREVNYGDLNGAPVDLVHARRSAAVDRPFPGGQSYRDVANGINGLLDELLRERDGQRVLLIGHAATRFALDHLLTARPLEAAVTAPFAWRPGWTYQLAADRPVGVLLEGAATLARCEQITAVYRAAFSGPGYDEPESAVQRFREEQLPTHAARPGFRCATVQVAGELVGFAYGYTGGAGQWWSDEVAKRADRRVADAWLGGHFEFVELAVDPGRQGRGFATALHDMVLGGLPHERALLTTYRDDRPAPRLYRRLGWQLLHEGVFDDSDLWGLALTAGPRPAD